MMNALRIAVMVVALMAGGCVAARAAEPAIPAVSSIAVIDVQRILDDSLAATSVRKQVESQRAKFQGEIEKEENGLRHAEQELTKARDQLTPDVYADREQQLRQRFLTVERHVQARRKALEQTLADSMAIVRKNLIDVVEEVARARGVALVLVKDMVVWHDKTLNVTDEVLTRLNRKLPQVTVKLAPEEK